MVESNSELKRENKALCKKIKQLQASTIKDLNKKLTDRDTEIAVLKEMIKSAQLETKGKENEIGRLERKIKRMLTEGYVDKMVVPNYHLHESNSKRQLNIDLEDEIN